MDNSNIFTITLLDELKYEELHALKNILSQNLGSDPVTFKIKDMNNHSVKILTSSMFWVESTNELVNSLKRYFGDKIEIDVRSLDAPEPATV